MTWSLGSILGYKGEMNNTSVNAFSIVKDVFKYYKGTLMSIFSFFIVSNAFTYLGSIAGLFSLLTLILIIYGIISMDIFNSMNPDHLSAMTSYEQAKKTCNIKANEKTKHGLLYNLIFSGGASKDLVREIKKVGKKINNV